MNLLQQSIAQTLPDLCAEPFAFALKLRRAKDPGTATALRNAVDEVLASLDRRARNAGIDAADVELARYALAAYLDEIVLSSNWDLRDEWASRPLQLHYFDDFTAGAGFYDRLDAIRGKPAKLDLLEVYATCLGLGFKGKYADVAGLPKVRKLLDELTSEILQARGQNDRRLAQSWEPGSQLPQKVKNLPTWIVAAACAGLLLVLLLVLRLLLGGEMTTFTTALGGKS